MTENTPNEETTQTPGKTEETEKEETFTKAQLTDLIQREVGKVTAKHAKKMEALQAELEAEKRKALPDPEKFKADIAAKDKALAESAARLAAYESRDKKRSALDEAKLSLPDGITFTDILDMMPGNSDEEIAGYVEKFKKMFPESRSLGTSTTQGTRQSSVSLVDQIRKLETDMLKLETPPLEKERIAKEVIKLKGKLSRGET